MLDKDKVIKSLNNMPESFTADELIDRILLLDKIEQGMQQAKSGQSIDDAELDEQLSKWLQ